MKHPQAMNVKVSDLKTILDSLAENGIVFVNVQVLEFQNKVKIIPLDFNNLLPPPEETDQIDAA